jgi:hypothetical protein
MRNSLSSFIRSENFYYKQTFNNSCGAASLLMDAYSLNINWLPELQVATKARFIKGKIDGIPLSLSEECGKILILSFIWF